ncbi:MAG: adenylate cyclase [Chthoniobacter sp.]|jgi:adenylate cyclase|nr:adenylate cyclase [Chthoniobacter sp.]
MTLGKRHHHRTLLISSLGWVALVSLLYSTQHYLQALIDWPYRRFELAVQDRVTRLARLAPVDSRLVFLADDAPSHTLDALWEDEIAASPALKLMKRRNWSREVYALILERLATAGAKVVGFDYMFQGEYDGDEAFRAALEKWRNAVVIGGYWEQTHGTHSYNPPSKSLIPLGQEHDDRVGYVNVFPDEDIVTRRVRPQTTREDLDGSPNVPDSVVYESLAARMVRKAGLDSLIPKDRYSRIFRYAFKGETLDERQAPPSLYGIFVPAIWGAPNFRNGAAFKDKIVLIGPEGRYNKDLLMSPFGQVAGPEFHLNAANAMLQGQFLKETSRAVDLGLIAAAALIAWLCGRFVTRPALRVILVVLLAAGCFWAAVGLHNVDWVVPVFSPLLTLLGAAFSFSIAEQILDRLERARLRRTFERYVSRDVVKELVDNPEGWLSTVGGKRKFITVLFSDVRGFTTLTESATDPQALVAQLNEYFDEMVRIVFAHNGTLDKFIGDAVMAHWGSIVSEGEATDARRAVDTGLQMRETLARLNPSWKQRGMLELQFGIGINHGEAIVGNLGCEAKMEVSVIGDAVNLASRLEGVTKKYHIDLCIGALVAPYVRDAFILRSLDLIVVQGKTKPVEIFAVLDARTEGVADPVWLPLHEEAMRLYRHGDFSSAETRWREVIAQSPGDSVSEVFLERCVALQKEPPAGEWTGIFEMKSK